jgi:hypothetical protein
VSAIPDIAFAAVLGFAALLAILVAARTRPAARDYLYFAAALYGALALADLGAGANGAAAGFASTVTLVIAALGPCALTLALAASFAAAPSARIAAPLLALAALSGIAAAASGAIFIAFAPLFACLCAMLVLALRHGRRLPQAGLYAGLAAFALLAAASAYLSGAQGRSAFALFSAAGLMGTALACAKPSGGLVKRAGAPGPLAIGRER